MKFLILLIGLTLIASCNSIKNNNADIQEQKQIYKSWVASKCIAAISSNNEGKQDALNSASAYLERSRLPIESLTAANPLISEFLAKNYQGSIPGTFNTQKCIDLFYSDELENVFLSEYKKPTP